MKTYLVYQSTEGYIIVKEKAYEIEKDFKDFEDFDHIGFLEADTNEICRIGIDKVPYYELLPLFDKIQSMHFAGDHQVRISRTKLKYDWEEEND